MVYTREGAGQMAVSLVKVRQHWHYGHNVAGYLPEADIGVALDFAEAASGLGYDLEHELGSVGYAPDGSEADALYCSLEQAKAELDAMASAGESGEVEFLTYVSDGGQHRLPTAWWITQCADGQPCEGLVGFLREGGADWR